MKINYKITGNNYKFEYILTHLYNYSTEWVDSENSFGTIPSDIDENSPSFIRILKDNKYTYYQKSLVLDSDKSHFKVDISDDSIFTYEVFFDWLKSIKTNNSVRFVYEENIELSDRSNKIIFTNQNNEKLILPIIQKRKSYQLSVSIDKILFSSLPEEKEVKIINVTATNGNLDFEVYNKEKYIFIDKFYVKTKITKNPSFKSTRFIKVDDKYYELKNYILNDSLVYYYDDITERRDYFFTKDSIFKKTDYYDNPFSIKKVGNDKLSITNFGRIDTEHEFSEIFYKLILNHINDINVNKTISINFKD